MTYLISVLAIWEELHVIPYKYVDKDVYYIYYTLIILQNHLFISVFPTLHFSNREATPGTTMRAIS